MKLLLLSLFTFYSVLPAQAGWNEYRFSVVAHPKTKIESWSEFWRALKDPQSLSDLTVKVLDEDGNPLPGSTVLVGSKKGDPFAENMQPTDSTGTANFRHELLRSGKPIALTIARSGFSTITIAENLLNSVEVKLQKIPHENDFAFLQGKLNGFPPGYGSGTMEMGVFVPAFRPDSFLNFDPQDFISSYNVKVNVYGERDVPGNLVFPPQNKWYGIVPISVSKPEFIMPLEKGMNAHMMAMAGAVDIGDLYDAVSNKDFLGAVNLIQFSHVNWTNRRVEVRNDERFDINFTKPIQQGALDARVSGIEAKLDLVSVSVIDPAGDRGDFVPLDVKAQKSEDVKGGQARLKLGLLKNRKPNDNFYLFSTLFDRKVMENKESNFRWIVGTLAPVNAKAKQPIAQVQSFLKPIKPGAVSGRTFNFSSPRNPAKGLEADFLLLNLISEKKNPKIKGKTRSLLWSSILPGNATSVTLPDLGRSIFPTPDSSKQERFWYEVIAIKSKGAKKSVLDVQSALRNLEHVSTLSHKYQ